jgi:DNA invertase Pin-like site-specific DNA recombinase
MLQKLLVDAKARRIDGIAVYRMDRLFRSLKDAVITLNLLTELGILFFSLKDQIDLTTSSGRLLAGMLAVFAEFEASLIKTRVISGLSAARARGVRLGRPIKVNEEIRSEVIALRESGNSIRQIEKIINRKISRTSIERIVAGISTDSKTKTEKGV